MIENKINDILIAIPDKDEKLYNYINYRIGVIESSNLDVNKKRALHELKMMPYLLKQECYEDMINHYRSIINYGN